MTGIGNLVVDLLLLHHLLLGLREVPPVAPRRRELGTVGHLGHGAELARALVPGHPKIRSTSWMTRRPVDAEAVVHPLEVEVHRADRLGLPLRAGMFALQHLLLHTLSLWPQGQTVWEPLDIKRDQYLSNLRLDQHRT